MAEVRPSICRNCLAFCPILVTVENGRAVKVTGDPQAGLYEGYSCPKGRALPEQHNDPDRLLHSVKRHPDGQFRAIASPVLVDEIAARVRTIVDEHGPGSVAAYIGTGVVSHPTGATMTAAWFRALGSPMLFSAATIDKPAANTSTALHGNWVAGAQSFENSDVWMLVGANPVISKSNGVPYHNPGNRLKEAVQRGMKLIVVDPRRTETAKRAHLHLAARPGEDAAILAAMIHVILNESLHDQDFVRRHAQGLDTMKRATAAFTPDYAAARAGISADEIIEAARVFARGRRGCVVCSTGASFSTRSTLTFYLALCLNTLCGRWAREGDWATYPNIMMPAFTPRAQAYPPYPVFGPHQMRVRGLRQNASGLPTAALPDEILTEGPGRIRALFCLGGNPMQAWPDQPRTRAALEKLDLLVVSDYRMTATASLADYVVASPLSLETPAATYFVEWLKYIGVSRGLEVPWAQYTPKIVDPPSGADLMDDRELFFRLGQAMAMELEWIDAYGYGPHVESPAKRVKLDMRRVPTVDDLIAYTTGEGRIPLAEVKTYPHGRVFEAARTRVEAAEPGFEARLELGAPLMMRELAELSSQGATVDTAYPFRLISRRDNNFMNSVGQRIEVLNRGRPGGALAMHPDDLAAAGLSEDGLAEVRSPHGRIRCHVRTDDTLRRGVVSMPQGFGATHADEADDPATTGASVTRLVGLDECEAISGMPRLSAIPVAISAV